MSYAIETLFTQEFTNATEVAVPHGLDQSGLLYRVVVDGESVPRSMYSTSPDATDPRNVFTIHFKGGLTLTGRVLVTMAHAINVDLMESTTVRDVNNMLVSYQSALAPEIVQIAPAVVATSKTRDIVIEGNNFNGVTTVTTTSGDLTVNSTTYDPLTRALTVNITTSANAVVGMPLTVDNGVSTDSATIESRVFPPWVWFGSNYGGNTLTSGTSSSNDIWLKPGMTWVVAPEYGYSTGIGPWSSLLRMGNGKEWLRAEPGQTVEWVVSSTTSFMFGIYGSSGYVFSTAQYYEGEIWEYFSGSSASTNYGRDTNVSHVELVVTSGSIIRARFENNGDAGSTVSWYRVALSDLEDESDLVGTYTVGAGLDSNSTTLYIAAIPASGDATRFYACRRFET